MKGEKMTPLQEVTLRRLQGQFESEIKQGHRTGALIVYYPMPAPAIDVMQLVNLAGNLPPITDITAEFLEGRLGGSTRLEKDRTHGSTLWLHGDANSLQLFDMLTADCCRALSIGCKSDLIFEWTRLLFVLGWRKIPGSPLWIDKWTVNGSLRFGAADRPLSADSSMDRFYQSIYNGAEPFTASALPDLFVASVKAIDLYLTRTVEPPLTDKTEHDGTTPNLIELLATKPENESLSDEDYALLGAFLNQPGNRLSLSRLQRGEADPFAKLRLIRKYNRNLRKQSLGIGTGEFISTPGQNKILTEQDNQIESKYLFCNEGAFYRIRFNGEKGTIPTNLKGSKYISEMLRQPNKTFLANELHALLSPR
jgi:hypothetical protein